MVKVLVEVETSLLTTKLNIPPTRPELVSRPRLIEQLNEGLNYKLILISAPAGFGKTTLLSEWVHQNKPRIPTAWVSLDEGDNDPIRFWDYFITALQTLEPSYGESVKALLRSPEPPPAESLMTVLINELAELLKAYRADQELLRIQSGVTLDIDDFVFIRQDGSPINPNAVTLAYRRILKRAGLRDIRIHDLRHTHPTLM